ncbi:MAG: hypothetical protein COU06_02290 [Candidatus Harrisonbacteria bacterium CG10_big_fil_rev_8_21_14_0_10_38_8]|uniref:Uncharacterized protein n=1 Tax=Candidatus Harrisonbacteria bacterium CG10_big_fil_rev_8_21_14_0_10_38_8 TaxID=1974582 RepID=A0A2M6WJT1_9BACT|nr:MAG: hypothetical protein COU06_02290 [Candidatus Harrisonbacteria bacterium CG10_big_fil_rev_8_21_14_0_10_38_8]
MRYSAKQYATALFEAILEDPGKEDEVISSFASLLINHNARSLVPSISRQIKSLERSRSDKHTAVITTAKKASSELITEIKKRIKGSVEITEVVDKGVLGGFKLVIDDEYVVDGTFSNRINRLFRN